MLGGKPDGFVNAYLLPGTHSELKTKVVKNDINPQWNETFRFQIPLVEIQKKTIVLQLSDWDRFTKNDKIGEVHIPLDQVDFSKMNKEWRTIQPPSKSPKPSKSSTRKSSKSSSDDEKKTQKRSSSAPAVQGPPSLEI
eukprot:TRINITY_DN24418_c0_g1_i1.p1 TRINITY_DN24418_c0_g1~~TRINITY_DN24418_c0_g1_i1.p1  ORF type:complete len:138 (-),score=23.20 TRINITY_DN24418_c0_g1_i1:330-743(-)